MRGKRILLSAVLLLSALTACHSAVDPAASSSSSSSSASPPRPGPEFNGSALVEASGSQSEPEPDVILEYDPDYTLDINYPKTAKGALELPVRGATGYASVQLPIWTEIPKPEPPAKTASKQERSVEPAAQPEPAAEPDPQPEPSVEPDTQPVPSDENTEPQPGDVSEEADSSGESSAPAPEDSSANENEQLPPAGPEEVPDASSEPSEPPSGPPDGEDASAPEEDLEAEPEPKPDPFEGAAAVLSPGTAFTILEENAEGDWWRVKCKAGTGWIENRYCFINLPDVIPSIVYNATNSYDSRFVTLGRSIPDVTGRAFYPGKTHNDRLDRDEFMMPVLYAMSKRICQAQQSALAQGNTLVLYEGYRPYEVQTTVYKALSALSRKDEAVKEAVASDPWNISWFIAQGYSNHQRGFAIDVTLARIQQAELQTIGSHQVLRVNEYEEYSMPTAIHELSKASATFTAPVASRSATAWKSATMTDTMASCEPALALQRYCTDAGLTPLASEWWHFNDLTTRASVLDNLSTGGYQISACLSTVP